MSNNKKKIQKYLNSDTFQVRSECGISIVKAKLKIINAELKLQYNRDVIHSTTSRLKIYGSVMDKMNRKGLEDDVDIMLEHINDLVGIRAVCSYTDDLYEVAELLCAQKDVRLLKQKDYIKEPKTSGYRSLHLIVEVPICLGEGTQWVKMEVQLRTAAMDYWANLDYQLQYKKSKKKAQVIGEELKEYAKTIEEMDRKVLELRKRIERL
ncbi:MAG: GTP pyrophosphokinase [Hespellia sp.]|nr:GTP pyrophosphokinase [Hespellia sp.]